MLTLLHFLEILFDKICLEYIPALSNWPLAIIILGLLFKKPIRELSKRLHKISSHGLVADFPIQDQTIVEAPTTDSPLDTEETAQAQPDQLTEYIRNNWETIVSTYNKMRTELYFEKVFNVIFGSQIRALEHLAHQQIKSDTYDNVIRFFIAQMLAGSKIQLHEYLSFLTTASLIEEKVDENTDRIIEITQIGLDFLTYIKMHYPHMYKMKPF